MISFPLPQSDINTEITDFESFTPLLANENPDDCNEWLELLTDAILREDFDFTKYILENYPNFTKLNANNARWVELLTDTSTEFLNKCFDLAIEKSYTNVISGCLLNGFKKDDYNELMSTLRPINGEQETLPQVEKFKAILLYLAITKQLPEAVKFLLDNNANPNVTCEKFGSPLCVAIKRLEYPIEYSWKKKESSAYQANNPAAYDIVEILLKNNVIQRVAIRFGNPNKIYTPLTYSVHAHDLKLFKLLLANNPHLADAPPMEATARFLSEADFSEKTPLRMAIEVKSRKMYDYITSLCPDLLLKEIGEVGDVMFNKSSYSKFVQHVLSEIPYEQRKLLFQAYHAQQGNGAVSVALRNDSLSMASTLLKFGENLPTKTNARGNTCFNYLVKRKLTSAKWHPFLDKYCQELKTAEATPSLVEMTTNIIHQHTHQNQFAVEEFKGYLPQELFELYQATPQRRENRDAHYKPVIRQCLEKALQPKEESVDQRQEKRAKM